MFFFYVWCLLGTWSSKTIERLLGALEECCIKVSCNPILPNLSEALDFLAGMLQDNHQYSAVNTARDALLAVLGTFDGVPFCQYNLVVLTTTCEICHLNTRLLLSYIKPHKPVNRDSVSCVVKLS